jgi:hypothetical protein
MKKTAVSIEAACGHRKDGFLGTPSRFDAQELRLQIA